MFRNHWSVENSLHHVKDRSWDEDVHTLRRPGMGEVYATLVNTGHSALESGESSSLFPTQALEGCHLVAPVSGGNSLGVMQPGTGGVGFMPLGTSTFVPNAGQFLFDDS